MSIKAGLVGLPNVGKSTLFNALTKSSVPAENYPFCTIDPHVAITDVPDNRLNTLQEKYQSKKIIPTTVTFVDIAGLVKGAASGEGLGNQFLSHIREVDLILHILRCFEDPNIIRAGDSIDPLDDYEVIMAELMLKDLESVSKRMERIPAALKKATALERKELESELALLKNVTAALNAAQPAQVRAAVAASSVPTIPLLSAKNSLIIANVSENDLENYEQNNYYQQLVTHFGKDRVIPISAKIEHELAQLSEEEAQELMNMFEMKERGLMRVIQKTYQNLNLITFFTCGPQEIHAWTITAGTTIRAASGEIHSDLERGFICAEVFNSADLFHYGELTKLKELGKIRTEGQDYIVKDGDIIHVKFNV